jgi:hypothetical protein
LFFKLKQFLGFICFYINKKNLCLYFQLSYEYLNWDKEAIMSIAVFAMRKMFLTLRINDLNFKLMNLSQAQMQLDQKGSESALGMLNNNGNDQQAKASQAQIQQSQNQISYLQKLYESQLKLAQSEVEQVSKGEEQAVKLGTPKYA